MGGQRGGGGGGGGGGTTASPSISIPQEWHRSQLAIQKHALSCGISNSSMSQRPASWISELYNTRSYLLLGQSMHSQTGETKEFLACEAYLCMGVWGHVGKNLKSWTSEIASASISGNQ